MYYLCTKFIKAINNVNLKQLTMNKVSAEHKKQIKEIISRLPKKPSKWDPVNYEDAPYELMIYEYQDSTNIADLDEFADFDGTMTNLEKVVNNIIKRSGKRLSNIDFKFESKAYGFDQFTIYQA